MPEESTQPTPDSPATDHQDNKPITEKPIAYFEVKHDWEKLYTQYVAWRQADQGSDSEFCLTAGVPFTTFQRKASDYKAKMIAEGLVRAKADNAESEKRRMSAKKSATGHAATLEAMLPAALATWKKALEGGKVETSARAAAEKMLKKFGLLDQDDAPDKLSELAQLSDSEVNQRLAALIPQQVVAKMQAGLAENNDEKTV